MAQYFTTYTDGSEQHIPADKVHFETDEDQYVFTTNGEPTAYAPRVGVLSIVRMPEPSQSKAVTG
ncbi:hypothetical protein SUDANB1_07181 [Streptomyces sp. enrichment culture]|uniref:hypothetical protein n=1 Tax=Streptomyces sp. enrichment culture TaxID=1795815 RepID=UPI003F551F53